jgi:hypothetical protein
VRLSARIRLALGRETDKARAALDQENAQLGFELFDASRQGRLGHATRLSGAAEMALPGQGHQVFQLIYQWLTPFLAA